MNFGYEGQEFNIIVFSFFSFFLFCFAVILANFSVHKLKLSMKRLMSLLGNFILTDQNYPKLRNVKMAQNF